MVVRSLTKPASSFLWLSLVGVCLVCAGCVGDARAQTDQPSDNPECISVRGDARYRAYGYDHVVIVSSRCERAASCRVATNVDPAEQVVTVAAGATRETVTRRGSPASAFTPRVACELRP